MRHAFVVVLCLLSLAASLSAQATETPVPAAPRTPGTAAVSYVTDKTVYVDAGREDGLREGAQLSVVRGGASIATLAVEFLSSHRASCTITSQTDRPVVGDSVTFEPARADEVASLIRSDLALNGAAPVVSRRPSAIHGRIGARYLSVGRQDASGATIGGDFSQPALDLLIDGAGIGGSGFGLSVDIRARRTFTTRIDGTSVAEGRTGVYQAALFFNAAGSPVRAAIGRQFSPALSAVSIFDGALFDFNKPSWGFGAFAGTQPDPVTFGFSTDIREFGAYVQWHNRPGRTSQWGFTTGAIGSYVGSEVNREFLFLQASYINRHFSAFGLQEVDYNRSWKRTAGEPTVNPTSTFLTLQYSPGEVFTIRAGFDNRRNVRLYRDYINTETEFDDSFRQGVWGGAGVTIARRVRLGAEARTNGGGSAGQATAYSALASVDHVTRLGLSLRARATRYSNPNLEGWLQSGALDVAPVGWLQVELTGGLRTEQALAEGLADNRIYWYGGEVDVVLGRPWYVMLSVTRETGQFERNTQVYGSLSFRF